MRSLTLHYAQGRRGEPAYLTHEAVARVAAEARAQLLSNDAESLTLETLAGLEQLNVNGLTYPLWTSLEYPVTDEQGQPVLGLCEFDPGCGEDAISVLIAPVGEQCSPPLALSTFAHELGHALFDAPAWLIAAKQGPDLFDAIDPGLRQVCRTATPDAEHLASASPNPSLDKAIRIAEYRANAFMGALLVPRAVLAEQAFAQADAFGVPVQRATDLFADLSATGQLSATTAAECVGLERLVRALAEHFNVNPAFIRVRLARYGLLATKDR